MLHYVTDMDPRRRLSPRQVSPLEATVLGVLWRRGQATSEDIGEALPPRKKLTDSTIRTVLRRLEAKGCVAHVKEGRRFVYRAIVERHRVAAAAAQAIIDTICGGSVGVLTLGLLEANAATPGEVQRLLDRLSETERP
jgi:BlaI family penicillinase repressor